MSERESAESDESSICNVISPAVPLPAPSISSEPVASVDALSAPERAMALPPLAVMEILPETASVALLVPLARALAERYDESIVLAPLTFTTMSPVRDAPAIGAVLLVSSEIPCGVSSVEPVSYTHLTLPTKA